MLDYGWKRLCSGLLAVALVAGMLPPVNVAAEETEDVEVVEILETEPAITEPVETEPVVTESVETTAVAEAVTEPLETTAATEEAEATEETVPETTAEIVEETTVATEETVAETMEATETTLPENVAAVQALIDALPDVDSVTEDDYDAVQEAYDAYEALTEEERALIQGAERFEGLFGWFNAQVDALGTVDSGKCGTNVTWVLTEDGTLTISGTGDMRNYSYYSSVSWYFYRGNITTVVIEEGVTSIGDYAFSYCSSLTSVTIPESVTSIGNSAFKGCSSLTSVTIPEGVTSISNSAFDGCSSLTSVTIPEGVTSCVLWL